MASDRPSQDPSGGLARRARMQQALDAIPLGRDEDAGLLAGWLEGQPAPEGDWDPIELVASITADGRRVTWWASGAPDVLGEGLAEYLTAVGAPGEELERLGTAGSHLEPEIVGSWLEVGHDALDGGWFFPSASPLANARAYAPPSPVSDQLALWARRCGAHAVARIRRSVSDAEPFTELVVPLPGALPKQQIELAQLAFTMLGAPWFGGQVSAALAAHVRADLGLLVGLNTTGLAHLGVLAPSPASALISAAVAATPRADVPALQGFLRGIGGSAPAFATCVQHPGGFVGELHFAP